MENHSQDTRSDQQKIELIRENQDLISGILGGLLAAFLGAVAWAAITVTTEYQIGYMAVGVGLAVGYTVRYFGRGIEQYFGFIGAVLALLGCLGGNILSTIGFISQAESLSYFQVLGYMNPAILFQLLQETFDGMDLLFYGIGVYEGYKFSFYRIEEEGIPGSLYAKAQQERTHTKIRAALLFGIIAIVLGTTFFMQSANDTVTSTYPSGAKMSEGSIIGGELDGQWTFWHENGQMQSSQFYLKGVEDGLWQWWDEEGTLIKEGNYKSGLPHGSWTFYSPSGELSQESSFAYHRKDGKWLTWYENGGKNLESFYVRDELEGAWTLWYENGNTRETGHYKADEKVGVWKSWYENGSQEMESEFTDGTSRILNRWSPDGAPQIVDGAGTYIERYDSGQTQSSGTVEDGLQVGIWSKWYENGRLMEERTFVNGESHLDNFWTKDGEQLIQGGKGSYLIFYDDGAKAIEGAYNNGLPDGRWIYLSANGEPLTLIDYHQGREEGEMKGWYENGALHFEGSMVKGEPDGEWVWWYENGSMQSKVTFVKGLKEGTQSFWSESEKPAKEEVYKNGELVSEKLLLP